MVSVNKNEWRALAGPAEVILKSNDVIFTQVITALNLDKNQRLWSIVRDTVGRADGDVDCFACQNRKLRVVKSDLSGPCDYDPVLGALSMFLIAPVSYTHLRAH